MPLTYRRRPGPPAEGGRGLVRVDGSTVALDEPLLRLLKAADGCTLDQILAAPTADFPTPLATRAAVACLVEARLLERHPMNEREEEKSPSTPPVLVSAVIVAWNGVHWLKALLPSLLKQTHDPIEIIVVDNGSTDETYGWVQRAYPDIRVLSLCPERSLAGAINAGVDEAQGDHFLVLNQDVRLKPTAVEELVRVAEADEQCAGVAANLRLLSAPAFLNGLGNQVGDSSWGTDNAMGHLDLGQFDAWKEVPSACFAAILIPANAWEQVGPADEAYPLYYEDIDWCYRARARGLRIRVAPRAVVLHAFGASTTDGETEDLPATKLERVVHGRLRFALKLLAGPEAKVFVRNYLREDLRGLRRALRAGCYREALAYPAGWGRAITDLPRLVADRRRLGACRASPAAILRDLPQDIPAARLQGQHPLLTSRDVMRDYGPRMRQAKTRPIPELGGRRRPVLLIVSQDVVDHRMAGPGLRYVEMARALARDVDPVLAIPNKTSLEVPGVHLVSYDELKPDSLQVLVDNADAAVVSGYMLKKFPFLRRTATRLVVDLYDPIVLENLHYYLKESVETQERLNQEAVDATNLGVEAGDFFVCGSERQRDFWLGVLAANGRVNSHTYADDETLRHLVDVVGIGLPSREPAAGRGLKGRHPSIPREARVVLWGGGIWNWLDPLTLIRAWPGVIKRFPDARLVFLGTRHPNPTVPRHEIAGRAEALARETGVLGESVVFIDWVDLDQREALLVEADVGVSLHPLHVETRYSVRSRIMDYFWARLPVVLTAGDVASEWAEQHGVGRVVAPGDQRAVERALVEILGKPRESWARPYRELVESLDWSRVVDPLLQYCLNGAPAAPDQPRRDPMLLPAVVAPPGIGVRALNVWRQEGALAVARRSMSRARRHLQSWA